MDFNLKEDASSEPALHDTSALSLLLPSYDQTGETWFARFTRRKLISLSLPPVSLRLRRFPASSKFLESSRFTFQIQFENNVGKTPGMHRRNFHSNIKRNGKLGAFPSIAMEKEERRKKKETFRNTSEEYFSSTYLLTNEIVLYEIVCVLSAPLATRLDEIRGSVSSVAVIFSCFSCFLFGADSIFRQFHL